MKKIYGQEDIDFIDKISKDKEFKALSDSQKQALSALLKYGKDKTYEDMQEELIFRNEDARDILLLLSRLTEKKITKKKGISISEAINIIRIKYSNGITSPIINNRLWVEYMKNRCGKMYVMGLEPQSTKEFYIPISLSQKILNELKLEIGLKGVKEGSQQRS